MDHASYASPFSWRYGSRELRHLFSEHERRRLWRHFWVALAASQLRSGLVSQAELDDLRAHAGRRSICRRRWRSSGRSGTISWRRSASMLASETRRREDSPRRDLDGRRGYGRVLPHARARSRSRRALSRVLQALAAQDRSHADLTCIALTHLQPAEPTTLGYRFAIYAQDSAHGRAALRFAYAEVKAKGVRGAVGTSASYTHLLDGTGAHRARSRARHPRALSI